MTIYECIVAILTLHREARQWADHTVAADLIDQLGLDAAGQAKNARPVVDPNQITEAEVVAAETAAKEAADKAKAARDALDAQVAAENDSAAADEANADDGAATKSSRKKSP